MVSNWKKRHFVANIKKNSKQATVFSRDTVLYIPVKTIWKCAIEFVKQTKRMNQALSFGIYIGYTLSNFYRGTHYMAGTELQGNVISERCS